MTCRFAERNRTNRDPIYLACSGALTFSNQVSKFPDGMVSPSLTPSVSAARAGGEAVATGSVARAREGKVTQPCPNRRAMITKASKPSTVRTA